MISLHLASAYHALSVCSKVGPFHPDCRQHLWFAEHLISELRSLLVSSRADPSRLDRQLLAQALRQG